MSRRGKAARVMGVQRSVNNTRPALTKVFTKRIKKNLEDTHYVPVFRKDRGCLIVDIRSKRGEELTGVQRAYPLIEITQFVGGPAAFADIVIKEAIDLLEKKP